MWRLRGCLAVKFDCCNNLQSSVHTLLVNMLRFVRLYIKRKIIIIIVVVATIISFYLSMSLYFCISIVVSLSLSLSLFVFLCVYGLNLWIFTRLGYLWLDLD